MAVGSEGKTKDLTISHKDGQFQPAEDTLQVVLRNSRAFSANPWRLLRANKQTKWQTNTLNDIYLYISD